MKKILVISVAALSGCAVSMVKPENWVPARAAVKQDLHACYMESQTPTYFANRNHASGGVGTKWSILDSCMQSKNYTLRPMTGGELAFTMITLPISTFAAVSTNDRVNFY